MKTKLFFCSLMICLMSILPAFAGSVVELDAGDLKLKVFEKTGSFCLYQLSTNGKDNYVPLFEDMAYGTTNKFSVNLNGKIYRLERTLGKPLNVEKIDNEIIMNFNIKNKLFVTQRFRFVPDKSGYTMGPLLKIETTLENTQSKDAYVALRAIFDTSLGEKAKKPPLATDLRNNITAETSFYPRIDKDSMMISSNKEVACMFFFRNGVDMPDQVYVANWEKMHPRKWLPKVVRGRSFNSKYLHDDSACLFIWSGKKLKPTEAMNITTAIGYHDFVRSAKEHNNKNVTEDKKIVTQPQPQKSSDMTEEQKKNYEYIQELLNRIHAVEENPDEIDDEELERLTNQAENAIKDIEEKK